MTGSQPGDYFRPLDFGGIHTQFICHKYRYRVRMYLLFSVGPGLEGLSEPTEMTQPLRFDLNQGDQTVLVC